LVNFPRFSLSAVSHFSVLNVTTASHARIMMLIAVTGRSVGLTV
jgi:hypothetical protein